MSASPHPEPISSDFPNVPHNKPESTGSAEHTSTQMAYANFDDDDLFGTDPAPIAPAADDDDDAWMEELCGSAAKDDAPDVSEATSEEHAPAAPVELTLFTKSGGLCTKRISLVGGAMISDGSDCRMTEGKARRVRTGELPGTTPLHAFADLIETMEGNQALCLGRLAEGIGDAPYVVKKNRLGGQLNTIARTQDFLRYTPGEPALMLIDFDRKGMPDGIKARTAGDSGAWNAIVAAFPALAGAGHVSRASTSSGLRNSATGEHFLGSGGAHYYVTVADGIDIARVLRSMHDRLWLCGMGWYDIGAAGQLLERSLVDRSVGTPEHLVFEGPPVVVPPLAQDQSTRRPVVHEGAVIDTVVAISELTPAEKDLVQWLKSEARRRLKPEADRVRAQSDRALAQDISKRTGIHFDTALRHVAARHEGKLTPPIVLPFDDDEIGTVTVGDILDDPERFVGETLADPLEGIAYGRCKAMVMRSREDGAPFIRSFAHGGTHYALVLDAARLRAEIERAPAQSAVDVLVANVLRTHLAVDELKLLCDLAASRTGVGVREIKARIKTARAERAKKDAERAAASQPADDRITFPVPAEDAEMTAVMARIDGVLSQVKDPEPPMRTLAGALCVIRDRPVLGLHELAARDDESPEERLPAPPEPLISELDADGTTMAVERYIRHTNSRGANARLPTTFARAYKSYSDSTLPRVIGAVTTPLITENGVLATDGLDRTLRLVFRIDPTLLSLVPVRVTDVEAKRAYRFLTDEWLCDVLTEDAGKAVTVAAALTLIERLLLPERPAFVITAGQRGGGKTTLANMLSTAVLGRHASAAMWSESKEERRKALISYFLEGPAMLVWDNLPRGANIDCPVVAQSLTALTLEDRILCRSEKAIVPATTVQFFTGNNIMPAGDMASRSLIVRLDVDRPDPENRDFRHSDPFDWTMKNRASIMSALFSLLRWNLRSGCKEEPKTRFKRWWTLCAAPVERISGVDFAELFRAHESTDVEVTGLAVLLDGLQKSFGTRSFVAGDLLPLCQRMTGENAEWLVPAKTALEDASGLPFSGEVNARQIGRRLQILSGRPVQVENAVLKLECLQNARDGNRYRLMSATCRNGGSEGACVGVF
jgi:hypothetical protein